VPLTDLAAQIAELQQRRDATLAGDSDIEAVAAIDRQADEQGRRLRALQDKISLLESRLASEQAAQSEDEYRRAVDKIASTLPRRAKAAEGVEQALANLAGAVKEFMVATEGILKVWPSDSVEWPVRVFPYHALSLERIGKLIQETFEPARGHVDRRPPTPGEFLTRACDADRPRGFAQREKELHEEFLADLKTAHDPPPVSDDFVSEDKEQAA
jgi:hypothetical protein